MIAICESLNSFAFSNYNGALYFDSLFSEAFPFHKYNRGAEASTTFNRLMITFPAVLFLSLHFLSTDGFIADFVVRYCYRTDYEMCMLSIVCAIIVMTVAKYVQYDSVDRFIWHFGVLSLSKTWR